MEINEGLVLIVPRELKSKHAANGILKDAGSTKRVQETERPGERSERLGKFAIQQLLG